MEVSLFDEGNHSDITIRIDHRDFSCHKLVLCDTSKYFNLLCGPKSKFRESALSTIELKEDGPNAAEAVLRHLYKFSYADIETTLGGFDANIHLSIALAADKHDVPELEKEALDKLDGGIRRIEHENAETTDAQAIFELIKLIYDFAEKYTTLASWVNRLTKAHLPALFSLKEFREFIEDPSAGLMLKVCSETLTRGHQAPRVTNYAGDVVSNSYFRCVPCGMVWLRRKIYACPECGNKKVQSLAIEKLFYEK